MAERRMFSKEIIDSDAFLDMPVSTQNLYFHLGMRADDQGFVNSPNKIMNTCKASKNDIDLLILKSFIIPFESGVVVIKHWLINNLIRADRLKPTRYQEEYSQLNVKNNDAYSLTSHDFVNQVSTKCQPNDRVGKDSIGKDNILTDNAHTREYSTTNDKVPSFSDVSEFIYKENLNIDPQRFYDYYSELNWKINGEEIESWRAVAVSWIKSRKQSSINKDVIGSRMSKKDVNSVIRNIEEINIDEEEM